MSSAGISALPMPLPDEVSGYERREVSRCHPDDPEIPPHPLQMTRRTLLTWAMHNSSHTPHPYVPPGLQRRKSHGSMHLPALTQTNLSVLDEKPNSGYLLAGWAAAATAHAAKGYLFRSVLKEGFWCLFTALKNGRTAAEQDTAESKQRLLRAAPEAVVVQS